MKKIAKAAAVLFIACIACLLSAQTTRAATGWVNSGGSIYYYDAAGNMLKGWVFLNGSWYYFGASTGIMQTGLLTDKGHVYYLKSNGAMATGSVTLSGTTYMLDANGAITAAPGWNKIDDRYYYFTGSNTVLTNAKTPDGYYVSSNGQWLQGAISKGIDVSRYQGAIDWRQVSAAGIDFAIVRVGSVRYGIDAYYHTNMQSAINLGLKTGVYIYSYATTPEEAVAEANFVLDNIKNYTISFPVAIDIEDNIHKTKTPAQLAAIANAFCATIEAAGYQPIIYGSKTWYSKYIDTPALNYDLWVAQYNSVCTYTGSYAIWQASSTGRVNGISGNVDINYLYKDYSSVIVKDGWAQKRGIWYFYKNYKAVTGLQTINGQRYYFDYLGRMQTGWALLNNVWYYFNDDGSMATGWVEYKKGWYYLNTDGRMQTGWLTIPSGTYYLTANGDMLTGWQTLDGRQYYFHSSGARAESFNVIGGKTYFFGSDHTLRTGWQTINGSVYYFDTDGAMVSGWTDIEGSRYYFSPEGILQKEWLLLGSAWYYLDKDTGVMAQGWLQLGENWFYLTPGTGIMLAGCTQNIGGVNYTFDANGYWIP